MNEMKQCTLYPQWIMANVCSLHKNKHLNCCLFQSLSLLTEEKVVAGSLQKYLVTLQ